MTNIRVNPAALYNSLPFGFSHAALQIGSRTLHCAGQVAWDKDGNIVGPGDLGAQTAQALANLKAVIEAAGATPADIVRVRTYVVNHSPEAFGPVLTEMAKFYGDAQPAPNTWIGVAALAMPDFMIEIEATVALP
jgi:enamine deaminase RidA (YjgF/YER057c/UK114 family)